MNEEWYIYPAVRNLIGKLATSCRILAIICAVAAIAEIVLLIAGAIPPALICGTASEIFFLLMYVGITILLRWSHYVLLAGQGMSVTRFFTLVGVIMGVIMLVCELYTLIMHEPLLIRQHEAPLLIWIIIFSTVTINYNRAATAPHRWRLLPIGFSLALLAVLITPAPDLLLWNAAAKVLLAVTAAPMLRKLSVIAPLIVSMPDKN